MREWIGRGVGSRCVGDAAPEQSGVKAGSRSEELSMRQELVSSCTSLRFNLIITLKQQRGMSVLRDST